MDGISNEELVREAANLTVRLAVITQPDETSLLPSSLSATNQVLSQVIGALEVTPGNATTVANEASTVSWQTYIINELCMLINVVKNVVRFSLFHS